MKLFQLFVVYAIVLAQSQVSAQSYTTIVENGASSNRLDVVFMGDGYTSSDIAAGTYDQHINNVLSYMFSDSLDTDPFYRYRNFFNVHKIDVVSNESGADVPSSGIFRDTALDASYGTGGIERLLSINHSKANTIRNTALFGTGFGAEMLFTPVNTTLHGGSGNVYAVYAGGHGNAVDTALHEAGHGFVGLADEYVTFSEPYPLSEPSQINVTSDPNGTKWDRWLGHDQPGIGVIGAYEGARYYSSGIYRPSLSSKMRTQYQPFDAIAREEIILKIYKKAKPLDSWSDNSTILLDPGTLSVDRIDDSVIEMQWFVDGSLIPTASGDTFNLADYGFGQGQYEVQARGFDPTGFDPVNGWVRKDQWRLEQFVDWEVTISVPEPTSGFLLVAMGIAMAVCCRK